MASKFDPITVQNAKILLAFADNNMRVQSTARAVHYCPTNVEYHLVKIKRVTGLNPHKFHDLVKLVNIMQKIVTENSPNVEH